jgi:hypothetical protein
VPELGLTFKDLAVLHQLIESGATLTEPRQVVYYSYASSEDVARGMGREAEAKGY